jgi:hypothetical protein
LASLGNVLIICSLSISERAWKVGRDENKLALYPLDRNLDIGSHH